MIEIVENGKGLKFDNFKAAHMYFTGMVNAGRWGLEAIRELKEQAETGDVTITMAAYQVTEDGWLSPSLTADAINAVAEEKRLAAEAEMAAIVERHEAEAAGQMRQAVELTFAARVDVLDVLLAAGVIDAKKHEETVEALRPAELKAEEAAEAEEVAKPDAEG